MTGWLKPIGFDVDEPDYEYHGESAHPDAAPYQCMCGHPDYILCELERDLGEAPGSYLQPPSPGMSHVATTGEGPATPTLRSVAVGGADEKNGRGPDRAPTSGPLPPTSAT